MRPLPALRATPSRKRARGKTLPSPVLCGRGARGKGFTLIELLVVLFIIAIITSVAVLALGDMGRSRKAHYFVEQLSSTLAYAQDVAITQPTTVLCQFNNHSYQLNMLRMIAHHDGSISYQWQPLSNLNPETTIPGYLTLSFTDSNVHQIQINSNGTMTPFTLRVSIDHENTYYQLTGNAAGTLIIAKKTSDN